MLSVLDDRFELMYDIRSKDGTFIFTEFVDNLYDIIIKYKDETPFCIPIIGNDGYMNHRVIFGSTNIRAIQNDYNRNDVVGTE